MNGDNFFGGLRNARGRGKTAVGSMMGDVGRQFDGGYDQAAGATQQAYGDAREAYRHALETAEQRYTEARDAAEAAYHVAQTKADALIAQGSRAYGAAAKRGRVLGEQAARYADDNKSLALLLAGGVGFLLALSVKRRPAR